MYLPKSGKDLFELVDSGLMHSHLGILRGYSALTGGSKKSLELVVSGSGIATATSLMAYNYFSGNPTLATADIFLAFGNTYCFALSGRGSKPEPTFQSRLMYSALYLGGSLLTAYGAACTVAYGNVDYVPAVLTGVALAAQGSWSYLSRIELPPRKPKRKSKFQLLEPIERLAKALSPGKSSMPALT